MGTIGYMSPELIEAYQSGDLNFNLASERLDLYKAGDIFALGISLFTMVVGIPPFASATKADANFRAFLLGKKRKNTSRFWNRHPKASKMFEKGELSEDFRNLIEAMLDPNQETRIKINGVISHPWMTKISSPRSEEGKTSLQ
jgi:serine/threonine protein kinase